MTSTNIQNMDNFTLTFDPIENIIFVDWEKDTVIETAEVLIRLYTGIVEIAKKQGKRAYVVSQNSVKFKPDEALLAKRALYVDWMTDNYINYIVRWGGDATSRNRIRVHAIKSGQPSNIYITKEDAIMAVRQMRQTAPLRPIIDKPQPSS
jgi:hypothetical protein